MDVDQPESDHQQNGQQQQQGRHGPPAQSSSPLKFPSSSPHVARSLLSGQPSQRGGRKCALTRTIYVAKDSRTQQNRPVRSASLRATRQMDPNLLYQPRSPASSFSTLTHLLETADKRMEHRTGMLTSL